jgi:hypothetical protein
MQIKTLGAILGLLPLLAGTMSAEGPPAWYDAKPTAISCSADTCTMTLSLTPGEDPCSKTFGPCGLRPSIDGILVDTRHSRIAIGLPQ